MERTKLLKILQYVGISAVVLAFVFFNVAPLLGDEAFSYVGITAFLKGLLSLVSFNFNYAPAVLFGGLFIISLVCVICWMIMVFVKKADKKELGRVILVLVLMIITFGIYAGMFAAKVDFNGRETVLYDGIIRANGNAFPKVLAMCSVGLSYLAVMAFTLLAFMKFEKMVVFEDEVKEKKPEQKSSEEKKSKK